MKITKSQLRKIVQEEVGNVLNEGLKPVNLSFADTVELNSKFKGKSRGKMTPDLYAQIVKKFGRTAREITKKSAAISQGSVLIGGKNKSITATIVFGGEYLKVVTADNKGNRPVTKFFEIA